MGNIKKRSWTPAQRRKYAATVARKAGERARRAQSNGKNQDLVPAGQRVIIPDDVIPGDRAPRIEYEEPGRRTLPAVRKGGRPNVELEKTRARQLEAAADLERTRLAQALVATIHGMINKPRGGGAY